MSSEVLEMYETLDEAERFEVDSLIQAFVAAKNTEYAKQKVLAEFEKFRGSISDEDAEIAYTALAECRKIEYGEW